MALDRSQFACSAQKLTKQQATNILLGAADAAMAWWASKRPVDWSVQQHMEHPSVNTATDAEKHLAIKASLWTALNEGIDLLAAPLPVQQRIGVVTPAYPHKLGICSACGRVVSVTASGFTHRHNSPDKSSRHRARAVDVFHDAEKT